MPVKEVHKKNWSLSDQGFFEKVKRNVRVSNLKWQ
jgi:hypothetical protein